MNASQQRHNHPHDHPVQTVHAHEVIELDVACLREAVDMWKSMLWSGNLH